MVPMGNVDHPRLNSIGLGPLGRPRRGHTLLTKMLVIVGQEGTTQRAEGGATAAPNFTIQDPTLRAYDKATGEVGKVKTTRPLGLHERSDVLHQQQKVVGVRR